MSTPSPARAFMSIGEVLSRLRVDYPDVTISKIRFLETEGLIEPSRTAAGYRKFSHGDMQRLRYVLTAQRDHYLPLRVIKDHLDALDRGLEPPGPGGGAPRVPLAVASVDGLPGPDDFGPDAGDVRLSRRELMEAAEIDDEVLASLEQFGLLTARASGGHFDAAALAVARAAGEMSRFGIEPRHLRAFKSAADREIGLVEQVVAPLARQRNPESRARADEVVRELAALSVRLHAALVKAGMRQGLGR